MKRNLSKTCVCILASTTFCLVASPRPEARAATDEKSVSGWVCRVVENSSVSSGKRTGLDTPGNTTIDHAFMNTGAGILTIVCPLVRDNANGTQGVSKTTKIRYKNLNQEPQDGPLSCALWSRNSFQTSADNESNTASEWHPDSREMTFNDDISSWTDGYYYVLCDLPPRRSFSVNSGIFAITLIEKL